MLNGTDKSAVSIDKCVQVVLVLENVLTNSLACTRLILHLTKELYYIKICNMINQYISQYTNL